LTAGLRRGGTGCGGGLAGFVGGAGEDDLAVGLGSLAGGRRGRGLG